MKMWIIFAANVDKMKCGNMKYAVRKGSRRGVRSSDIHAWIGITSAAVSRSYLLFSPYRYYTEKKIASSHIHWSILPVLRTALLVAALIRPSRKPRPITVIVLPYILARHGRCPWLSILPTGPVTRASRQGPTGPASLNLRRHNSVAETLHSPSRSGGS